MAYKQLNEIENLSERRRAREIRASARIANKLTQAIKGLENNLTEEQVTSIQELINSVKFNVNHILKTSCLSHRGVN